MTTTILLVGGADTSRAPMAAALLRRLLAERGLNWPVESAGVLGHDGDPAEPEARNALMATYSLDISAHRARSLDDELVATARILIAVDSGTLRVIRLRYPDVAARSVTLGELAGRQRDIPDPFRMQLGAWISYVHEIERLLRAGLDQLVQMLDGDAGGTVDEQPVTDDTEKLGADEVPAPASPPPPATQLSALEPQPALPTERSAALDRCERLLTLMRDMPTLVEWANARRQLEAELTAVSSNPLHPTELLQPYVSLFLALLGMSNTTPTPGQLALLQEALARLHTPVDQPAIVDLSGRMTRWGEL